MARDGKRGVKVMSGERMRGEETRRERESERGRGEC